MGLTELIGIAKALFELFKGSVAISQDRADRAATYFLEIAANLAAGGAAVRDRGNFSLELGRLQEDANDFLPRVTGLLEPQTAERMAATLKDCLTGKQMMTEVNAGHDDARRAEVADLLLVAAGKFQAIAGSIRARIG